MLWAFWYVACDAVHFFLLHGSVLCRRGSQLTSNRPPCSQTHHLLSFFHVRALFLAKAAQRHLLLRCRPCLQQCIAIGSISCKLLKRMMTGGVGNWLTRTRRALLPRTFPPAAILRLAVAPAAAIGCLCNARLFSVPVIVVG